jgi:hypothetical protein
MSYDPQCAPAYYESRIGPIMTDTDGIDIVLVHDQDGVEYVREVNEEDPRI